MKWPMVKIEDIFDVARGGSLRPIDDFITDDPDGVNWIMIGDTKEGGKYIESTGKKIRPEGVSKSRMVHEGDFLLTNSMSFGRPYILKTSGCIHDGWLVLSPKSSEISTDYFYYYLGSQEIKNKLSSKAAGAVVKNLNKDIVKSLEIPLPPLAEQQRIAAILDKADSIRRKRQQAIQLADEFLRAVFLDMFGDPVTNPKGWEVRRLGDVVDSQLGKMLSQKAKSGTSPFKYLRNANVRWREFELDDLLEMDFNEKEQLKFKLEIGDLLVCEGGDVGRCAIWKENINDCFYQKALHRVRPNYAFLTSEYLQEYFFWMSRKGGLSDSVSEVTFSHLTAEKLKELKIPIPPTSLQMDFVNLYGFLEKLVVKNHQHEKDLNLSIGALSQKAFKGEL